MSQQLQLIYDEVLMQKKEARDLKEMYKDALAQADEYQELTEKITKLREKRKQIEIRIQGELGKAWEKLEDIKYENKTKKEMMTYLALTALMKGETVELKDEYENHYEPVWSVKFVKVDRTIE